MFKTTKQSDSGVTVVELLVAIAIFSLVLRMGFSGFRWFQDRSRISHTLRTVTSALNFARYQAIEKNRPVKICLEGKRLHLKNKSGGKWQTFTGFDLEENLAVSMNASPVFFPTGFVSPLCSVSVKHGKSEYKITISIAGRIKVTKII
jgi:prepilin-type N-terminal cleavage/methylation domain-containing protein